MRRTQGNVFCLTLHVQETDGEYISKTFRRHQSWDDTKEDVMKKAQRQARAFVNVYHPDLVIEEDRAYGWTQTWYAERPRSDAQ